MYRLWCAYNIGQYEVVFTSITAAKKWAAQAIASHEVNTTVDQLWRENRIGVHTLEVVDEKGYV